VANEKNKEQALAVNILSKTSVWSTKQD